MMRFVWGVLLVGLAAAGRAENWPQWRGPFANGSTTETNLPVRWSKTEGVAWRAPLAGHAGATPIVWEDTIFVASPDEQKNLLLLCLDRKTGRVRWQKAVTAGDHEQGLNNMASPSPATDGRSVFVMFADGVLAAFDFAGNERWRRDLAKDYGRFANMWMYGSSPLLHEGRLYVQVLQQNPCPGDYPHAQGGPAGRESFLLCLDPETGTNHWRQVRATDARLESQEAYSTPIPAGNEILVAGADYVTAHAADTGEELWRCGGLNPRGEKAWRMVTSPVPVDGLVAACGPRGDALLGIRDGGRGLVTATHLAWTCKAARADCPTPLAYRHRLFVLDGDRQTMMCLDPKTGAVLWQGSLGVSEIFRASPTGADGRVYCVGEGGSVVVLEAGDEFKLLATVHLGEGPVRSSVVAAQGGLFIRTAESLYCIAGQ